MEAQPPAKYAVCDAFAVAEHIKMPCCILGACSCVARSGNVFQQPLNDEGKAEADQHEVGSRHSIESAVQVDIAVLASDRKHKVSGTRFL